MDQSLIVLMDNVTICYSPDKCPVIAGMSIVLIIEKVMLSHVYTPSHIYTCI